MPRRVRELLIQCINGKRSEDYLFTRENGKPVKDFRGSWEKVCNEAGLPGLHFHDLRRTGSTILNELGFNSDWIEKCLAHEDGRSSRGIYNKAEYAEQRRHMLQEWADMVDAWVAGESHTPTLLPPSMKIITTQALL